jgi:hypothetical protein
VRRERPYHVVGLREKVIEHTSNVSIHQHTSARESERASEKERESERERERESEREREQESEQEKEAQSKGSSVYWLY